MRSRDIRAHHDWSAKAARTALPAALAVIEAAEAMEEHRDFFCECDLLPNGHKCPVCTVLAAIAAFREVKL